MDNGRRSSSANTPSRRIRLRHGVAAFAAILIALTSFTAPAQAAPVTDQADTHNAAVVRLRVEGATSTVFEGLVVTTPHDVTTAAGGTHHCDGTNNGANPTPGPTAIGALDDGAVQNGFDWDGPFFPQFDDYLVTRISTESQTATTWFSLLRNGVTTEVGGCQQQVETGDEVLFAISSGTETAVLKLTGPYVAKVGQPAVYSVVDAGTGAPIAGATVGGATTDAAGLASITFTRIGVHKVKAERADAIRSNATRTVVVP